MQKIVSFFEFITRKEIKTYGDVISFLLFPLISLLLFYLFLINFYKKFYIGEINQVQTILIGVIFLFYFLIPFLKKVIRKKTISSFIFLYANILINSALLKNPLILLILLIPIIGKDSYLYLSIIENFKKSTTYIFIASKMKEKLCK